MVGVVRYVRASETVVVRVVGRFTVVGIHGGRVMVGVGVVVLEAAVAASASEGGRLSETAETASRPEHSIDSVRVLVMLVMGRRALLSSVPSEESHRTVSSRRSTRPGSIQLVRE